MTKTEKKTVAWHLKDRAKELWDDAKLERAQAKDKNNEQHETAKKEVKELKNEIRLLRLMAKQLS